MAAVTQGANKVCRAGGGGERYRRWWVGVVMTAATVRARKGFE